MNFENAIERLPTFVENSELINVIVETPKGSRNKYSYDPDVGLITVDKILPVGCTFPLDFGFVPGTLADDGDPLDVLVLSDEPCFPGCWITARILGVMQAEQSDKGAATQRNDRLIVVSDVSREFADLHTIRDLKIFMLDELGNFFRNYHAMLGNQFNVLGFRDVHIARETIMEAMQKVGLRI